jgi:hypothetical protein
VELVRDGAQEMIRDGSYHSPVIRGVRAFLVFS